ncbi:tRNA pseudouridine(55) synthase TruB [uncultured Neptuniibacter sp.]|uniref:tRNA pseudouridine(55) synthase TruB n=1 Tax=uncultured Neptuniibacter sp. TaxID=502143 RepID=UPI0026215EA4|nr:tRNA pseudouridine(55) synthase TruB [uncultured Neptuniibacter sp.]
MGRRRKSRGRAVDGVFLLNKPSGISSNSALQQVRRIYGAAKAGHTGALDPLATGMLPICLGEATKFSQHLLDSDKRYITTAKLGIRTDSSDADGAVVEEKPVPEGLTASKIDEILQSQFSGEIEQVPSMFSALKHQGQPLYKLARKGIEVEVKPRRVMIHQIKLLALRADEVDIEVFCSKGTYIRSIVEDLGHILGCGAHVSMLHRLDVGAFTADRMMSLDELRALLPDNEDETEQKSIQMELDKLLLPAWAAVDNLPAVSLDDQQTHLILHGQSVAHKEFADGRLVRLFGVSGQVGSERFLGVAEVIDDHLKPKRLICTEADQ